jgi:hypothetical protein
MCVFRAMDHLTASRCPLCRQRYRHLPSPSPLLDDLVAACAGTDVANARTKEAEAEAREEGAGGLGAPRDARPESERKRQRRAAAKMVEALRAAAAAEGRGDGGKKEEAAAQAFLSCAVCKGFLRRPVVLSCGCVVCGGRDSACVPYSGGGSGGGGSRGGAEPAQQRQQQQQQQQRPLRCLACSAPVGAERPRPCKLLDDLIRQHFPARWQEEEDQQQEQQRTCSPPPAATSPPAAATTTGLAELLPPDVIEALREALTPAAAPRSPSSSGAALARATRALRAHADQCFVWHGIGCDACGVFPVVGRRYRCADCPEAVGYDLCGGCRDATAEGDEGDGAGEGEGEAGAREQRVKQRQRQQQQQQQQQQRGRFNQRHRASHRMVKVRPSLPVLRRLSSGGALVPLGEGEEEEEQEGEEEEGGGGGATRTTVAAAMDAGAGGGSFASALTGLMNLLAIVHPDLPPARLQDLLLMQLQLVGRGGGEAAEG